MKRSIIILTLSCLVLSNPASSQARRTTANLSTPRPPRIQPRPSVPLQMRRDIQRRHSKLKAIHAQATAMAAQNLNPRADREGELITVLKIMGNQTDRVSRTSFEDMDIDALTQLVMFELWANEDLEDMHNMNEVKQSQRELVDALRKQKQAATASLIDAINAAAPDTRPTKRVTLSRDVDLISGPGSKMTLALLSDVRGSTIEVRWAPDDRSVSASLALAGPGKPGYYHKKDGKGPLTIAQQITPEISKRGRLWQVSLSIPRTSRYLRVKGKLTVTYVAHYSPSAPAIPGRKATALKQTQRRFTQLMNDSFTELQNIRRKDPAQSNDFAVREAVRYLNRASNLIDTAKFATQSNAKGLTDLYDALRSNLDGINELSEMTSLRLQMTMDRRSKFISTLSQMMKKISTTQDTLVQNIK